MTNSKLNCPICGEIDMVQKVSAAVHIYKQLEPPAKPSWREFYGDLVAEIISMPIFYGILCLIFGWEKMTHEFIFWSFICLFFFIATIFMCVYAWLYDKPFSGRQITKMRQEKELRSWNEAMKVWNELYYCARDDGVFNPHDIIFIPTKKLQSHLYNKKKEE